MSKLQERRIELRLTQSQLAEKVGMNVRTLQCYEQGFRSLEGANFSVLMKLCKILECEISDILENESVIREYEDYINSILE